MRAASARSISRIAVGTDVPARAASAVTVYSASGSTNSSARILPCTSERSRGARSGTATFLIRGVYDG
jgi:hypothetical protein